MSAHEIDYAIMGEEIQCVEVQLDPGESVIAEAGSFMMMDQEITMETIFGDGSGGSRGSGLMGKLMGAGKRLLTGESLFMTVFTHSGSYGRKSVTFAAPYPGKIIPLDLQQYGGKIICQKDSFLCAAKGVSIGIEFQRKLGTGFFGGEGFIMQKLEGDGLSFVHSGGYVMERTLQPGETLKLDTGCLVAMTSSVDYNIEFVKGSKPRCSAAKACSSQRCADPARCGYSRCHSAEWLIASCPLPATAVGKKKEACLAGSAICWMVDKSA